MSVEHVLPRKSNPNSQWRGWFADPSEREVYTESLGNLVLVTKAQNDRAGNQDFARKLEVYFKTPAAPLPALNEALRGVSEWKAAQIKAREAELLRLIEGLWNFGLKVAGSEAGHRGSPRSGTEDDDAYRAGHQSALFWVASAVMAPSVPDRKSVV